MSAFSVLFFHFYKRIIIGAEVIYNVRERERIPKKKINVVVQHGGEIRAGISYMVFQYAYFEGIQTALTVRKLIRGRGK